MMNLEEFALRELLEFMRKELPAWPEGAVVQPADGEAVAIAVDGKLLVQVLMRETRVEALLRVLERAQPLDADEGEAVSGMIRALRAWSDAQAAVKRHPKLALVQPARPR